MRPATREAMHDLAHRTLAAEDWLSRPVRTVINDRRAVVGELRNACFAEVLADDNVSRKLAPRCRNLCVLHLKHGRAIGISDAARAATPLNGVIDILARLGEASGNLHGLPKEKRGSRGRAGRTGGGGGDSSELCAWRLRHAYERR